MIIYTVKCENGHEFEGWFGSSSSFDREVAAGEVPCPSCGSVKIEKAPMAPSVGSSKKGGDCGFAGADTHAGAPACMSGCGGGCMPKF